MQPHLELRAVLEDIVPKHREKWGDSDEWEGLLEFQRELGARGWSAPAWPVEIGGRSLGVEDQIACDAEFGRANAPRRIAVFGTKNVGPTIAAELMLTGRRFSAEEALRFGMLNRVVARDDLLGTAVELAALITANSEYGVYMTKLGMWANLDAPSLRHAIELENRTQVLGTFTRNMTEAGRAFVEKRDPEWNPM